MFSVTGVKININIVAPQPRTMGLILSLVGPPTGLKGGKTKKGENELNESCHKALKK
jgi:hypothetical protein